MFHISLLRAFGDNFLIASYFQRSIPSYFIDLCYFISVGSDKRQVFPYIPHCKNIPLLTLSKVGDFYNRGL